MASGIWILAVIVLLGLIGLFVVPTMEPGTLILIGILWLGMIGLFVELIDRAPVHEEDDWE